MTCNPTLEQGRVSERVGGGGHWRWSTEDKATYIWWSTWRGYTVVRKALRYYSAIGLMWVLWMLTYSNPGLGKREDKRMGRHNGLAGRGLRLEAQAYVLRGARSAWFSCAFRSTMQCTLYGVRR